MSLFKPDSLYFSSHVLAIPKLDKADLISGYLQEQTAYAKTYAFQGRAHLSSWKRENLVEFVPSEVEETLEARLPSKLLVVDYGFGTPVLKPRVVMRTTEDTEHSPDKEDEEEPESKDLKAQKEDPDYDRELNVKCNRTTSGSSAKAIQRKPKSRKVNERLKQMMDSDLESERAKRLKARRERKRAKRAIIKPTTATDTESEVFSERKTTNKGKAKKKTKTRMPASLSLMHGFSATNVGSGRLTMKPSLSVGVFNKGKASAKAQVIDRNFVKGGIFIENDFLNKTRTEPEGGKGKRKHISSSSSCDSNTSSTHSEEGLDNQEKTKSEKDTLGTKRSRKLEDAKSKQKSTADDVAGKQAFKKLKPQKETLLRLDDETYHTAARSESITWDIENDDANLPSRPVVSETGKRSAVIDTGNIEWSGPDDQPLQVDTAMPQRHSPLQAPSDIEPEDYSPAQGSGSSIGPSESASQYGRSAPCRDLLIQESSSKYFATPVIRSEPVMESPPLSKNVFQKPTSGSITRQETIPSNTIQNTPPIPATQTSPLKPLFPSIRSVYDTNEPGTYKTIENNVSSLEYLPEVAPQEYEYSDGDLQMWPPDDTGRSGRLFQIPMDGSRTPYSDVGERAYGFDDNDNDCLSFHQWHELEGSFNRGLHAGAVEYKEEQGCVMTGTWAGDEGDSNCYEDDDYYSLEHDNDYGYNCEQDEEGSGNFFQGYHSDNSGQHGHGIYGSESPEDDLQEEFRNTTSSGNLDLFADEEENTSIDSSSRFAQGRTLLLDYSEQDGRLGVLSKSSRRPQLPLAEADVVKGLRNHWFPQRL
ncbi:hypothetical protein D9615_000346 [Tricholomella constricta]|uniref:Uncharacterized protein n=1 Tax=Tricholomella constricta TaxID=117010 RepID=A0A8H5MBW6_9AGAR|nr:hypothetical protein D9615_000346 [Tricholomella constricta]